MAPRTFQKPLTGIGRHLELLEEPQHPRVQADGAPQLRRHERRDPLVAGVSLRRIDQLIGLESSVILFQIHAFIQGRHLALVPIEHQRWLTLGKQTTADRAFGGL